MGPSHDRDFGGDDIGVAPEVRKRSQAVEGVLTEGQATAPASGRHPTRGEAIRKDGDIAQSYQPFGPLGIVPPDPVAAVEEHNAWERAGTFRPIHRGRDRCALFGIRTLEGDPLTVGRSVSPRADAEEAYNCQHDHETCSRCDNVKGRPCVSSWSSGHHSRWPSRQEFSIWIYILVPLIPLSNLICFYG
jgi:hypothetical protein